jgi:hypothetical protein
MPVPPPIFDIGTNVSHKNGPLHGIKKTNKTKKQKLKKLTNKQ